MVYAPRGSAEPASPYLVCHCPPGKRGVVDALVRRWGIVALCTDGDTGLEDVVVDPETEPWSAAELGSALEEAGCSFSLFLAAAADLDSYLWLFTPALGRFESAASVDGTTVLVRADDLDKAVADCDSAESLGRAVNELTGRAHREAQGAVRTTPAPLEMVRAAARDFEFARRRRDTAIAQAKADGSTLREMAEAANLSVARVKQIAADPPGEG